MIFIDASAFCAIFLTEPDGAAIERRIGGAERCWTSPVAGWETVRALIRADRVAIDRATARFDAYLKTAEIEMMSIGALEHRLALEAFDRFGKGRHPAALNMGDCFA